MLFGGRKSFWCSRAFLETESLIQRIGFSRQEPIKRICYERGKLDRNWRGWKSELVQLLRENLDLKAWARTLFSGMFHSWMALVSGRAASAPGMLTGEVIKPDRLLPVSV